MNAFQALVIVINSAWILAIIFGATAFMVGGSIDAYIDIIKLCGPIGISLGTILYWYQTAEYNE
jgi:hypothetical protein